MDVRLYMKFGSKLHLEQMQKEGLFYCNTITYFSNVEDETRKDPFESVCKLEYIENAIFHLRPANDPTAEWKKLRTMNAQYKEHYDEPLGNLFCMSAFKINPRKKKSIFYFDERFLKFEYCLLIMHEAKFKERLQKSLDGLNFNSCMRQVNYIDLDKYSGEKTLFQKDLKHSWQEEFRIILYTDNYKMHDPFKFSMGNIEDISQIIDLSKTKQLQYKL
jgi:hypothetical protein